MARMKQLPLVAALLLIGCSHDVPASFTIIEHTTPSANKDGYERFVVRYDYAGHSVILHTRCGFTDYKDRGGTNQGFCPSERLPALGTAIRECKSKSESGVGSPTCAVRAQADYLAIHEGGRWGDEEINLYVESEKAVK